MQNRTNIGYDETKKMLDTLRKLNESKSSFKTINEASQEQRISNDTPMSKPLENRSYDDVEDDVTVINDVEVNILSSDSDDMKIDEEQKTAISQMIDNFKQQVSQIVDFDPGMTINENQIRLDGTITDEDISFVFIAGQEGGLYINSDMLKMENEVMVMLDKLLKFEETFKTAMEPLISQRNNN